MFLPMRIQEDLFLQEMAERAVRFAPSPFGRVEPRLEMEEYFDGPVYLRPPLHHALDKPIEQLLAEEMAYYSVPLRNEGAS